MIRTDLHVIKSHYLIGRIAASGKPFTSDDLRDLMEREHIELKVQALGQALAEAKMAGYIKTIGEQPSRRESNHRRRVDVWVLTEQVIRREEDVFAPAKSS